MNVIPSLLSCKYRSISNLKVMPFKEISTLSRHAYVSCAWRVQTKAPWMPDHDASSHMALTALCSTPPRARLSVLDVYTGDSQAHHVIMLVPLTPHNRIYHLHTPLHNPTRIYMPSLPTCHTHTRHTASRGILSHTCIRHHPHTGPGLFPHAIVWISSRFSPTVGIHDCTIRGTVYCNYAVSVWCNYGLTI